MRIATDSIAKAVADAIAASPEGQKGIRLTYKKFENIMMAKDVARSKSTIRSCWLRFAQSEYSLTGCDAMNVPSEIVVSSSMLSIVSESYRIREAVIAEAVKKERNKQTNTNKNTYIDENEGTTWTINGGDF